MPNAAHPSHDPARSPARIPGSGPGQALWALLLARIDEIFPLRCPDCGGSLRIIAFLTEPASLNALLRHLGEPTTPPKLARAHGPPLWDPLTEALPRWENAPAPVPEYVFDQRLSC